MILYAFVSNAHGFEFWRKLTEAENLQIVHLIWKKQNTRVLTLPFNKKPRTFCFFRLGVLMPAESEIMEWRVGTSRSSNRS